VERFILDPSELAEGRTELDITDWVDVAGVNWGDAEINAYRSQGELGEKVIETDYPNRPITMPMALREQGGTTFATARSYIQAKAALWQREGGILKRILATGGTVYADIVANGLTLSGDWFQANKDFDTEAELRLEAIPDFYEPEELIAEAEETSAAELVKVIEDPRGDMPARVRVVVEEKQGVDQKALIWSFRSRYYSSASTAKVAYEAEEMSALGEAAAGSLSGASNGTAVSHTALPAAWTPVVGTNLGGTGYLTHQGVYRVYARLRSPDGTAVSARFVWDVGDLVNPTENDAYTFPAGSAFYVADLGELRLNPAPIGTHRWQGQIQARGTEGGEDINIDKVWLVNCDDGEGVLSAPPQPTVGELKAWDNFNTHSAGTITGKVASLGGTWTGAGDAVGFTIDTTNKWITRSEVSDANANTGRYERLGSGAATNVDVTVDVRLDKASTTLVQQRSGLMLRYTDVSNWLMVVYEYGDSTNAVVIVYKRVAGTVSTLGKYGKIAGNGSWRTLRATVDSSGFLTVYEGPQGAGASVLSVSDSALAASGALESGGYGIYDAHSSADALTRAYDNFYVTVPSTTADAVIFADQKAQLTNEGMYRLDSGGTAYGRVSRVVGDLPRLPAGGLEGRSAELFLKASRGDMDELPDSGIDDIAAKIYASRSWLTVPGTI